MPPTRHWFSAVAAQPAALAEFQGQPARLLVVLDFPGRCSCCRCSPSSSPTTSRSLIQFDGQLVSSRRSSPIPRPPSAATFETAADYRDPYLQKLIADEGRHIVWPLIRYSYDTHNLDLPTPAPSKPTWMLTRSAVQGGGRRSKGLAKSCRDLEYNWLGTDDQGRDVVARLIYGFRISVLFGLIADHHLLGDRRRRRRACRAISAAGSISCFQRFIEIWTVDPLALSAADHLLGAGAGLLRAARHPAAVLLGVAGRRWCAPNSCAARNFEYIMAARALGVSNAVIMFRHLLPNAMVATMTFLPFILSSSVMTLTALDFLGFGLPPGSPSLGELLAQGKANVQAPWLGLTGFFAIAIMLSLLIFIGEARARRLRSAQDVPMSMTPSTASSRRPRSVGRLPPGGRDVAGGRSRVVRHQARARRVALVGESGSGKSVTALSVDEAAALSDRASSVRRDPLQGPGTARRCRSTTCAACARQRHHASSSRSR